MKFLSDILYATIPTKLFAGKYCDYEVRMHIPSFVGSKLDNSYEWREETITIYQGKIYGTGNDEKLYLNDIISSYVYDNSYIEGAQKLQSTQNGYSVWFSVINPTAGVLFKISVLLVGYGSVDVEVEDDSYIMNMYRDPKTTDIGMIDLSTTNPMLINMLLHRTDVYPRIPNLPYTTTKFWVGGLFAATNGWIQNSTNASGQEVVFIGNKFTSSREDAAPTRTTLQHRTFGPIIACSLSGSSYSLATSLNPTSLYLVSYNDATQPYSKLADIDQCPAEYYLIWLDRTGAYQCQPFSGKVMLTENIETDYTVDLIDQKHVSNKIITNTWTLNSDWLNYKEYKAYESIFSSKYLYLFNTEHDEGYEVILNNKQWSEKTKSNKDKMFNLQIEVSEARPQNITY